MALATEVSGDGILVSRRISSFDYWVVFAPTQYKVRETQTSEQREWVALTQSAAINYAIANAQPASGTYTYDVSEENRVVGSYKVTRTFELTETSIITPE